MAAPTFSNHTIPGEKSKQTDNNSAASSPGADGTSLDTGGIIGIVAGSILIILVVFLLIHRGRKAVW